MIYSLLQKVEARGNFEKNINPNYKGKTFQRSIGAYLKRKRTPSKNRLDDQNNIVQPSVCNQLSHKQIQISIFFLLLLLHNFSQGFMFVFLN
jgi:hypothetical protein